MKKIFLILTLTICSCTSVRIFTPNPAVEPPELRGDRGIKLGGELVGSHETKATDNIYKTPPDMAHPELNTAFDFFSSAVYSPIEEIEAGLEVSPLHGGYAAIFRWQPVGEGAAKSEEGNIPLAFYLKGGQGQSKGEEDDYSVSFSNNYRASIRESYVHAGFSSGYRLSRNLLLYAGAAYGQYWMRAEVDQGQSVYVGSSVGNGITGGAGVYCTFSHVQFFASGEFTHLAYSGTSSRDDLYLHSGVTFTFGH